MIKSRLCFSSLYNSHSFESKAKIRSWSPPLFQVYPEVQVCGYDLTNPHLETCHSMDKFKQYLVPPPNTLHSTQMQQNNFFFFFKWGTFLRQLLPIFLGSLLWNVSSPIYSEFGFRISIPKLLGCFQRWVHWKILSRFFCLIKFKCHSKAMKTSKHQWKHNPLKFFLLPSHISWVFLLLLCTLFPVHFNVHFIYGNPPTYSLRLTQSFSFQKSSNTLHKWILKPVALWIWSQFSLGASLVTPK